jgi:hypothetical protein
MNKPNTALKSGSTQGHNGEEGDFDLIALWLDFDVVRIFAGVAAGLFAGVVMAVVAILFSVMGGHEVFYALKIPAIPILGAEAMNYGMSTSVVVGFIVHEIICAVLGGVYAHFTHTNHLKALLAAGFMWGCFSWVFIQNLFIRSFPEVMTLQIPSGVAFFVLQIFGLSLSSVIIFDRMIAGKKRA